MTQPSNLPLTPAAPPAPEPVTAVPAIPGPAGTDAGPVRADPAIPRPAAPAAPGPRPLQVVPTLSLRVPAVWEGEIERPPRLRLTSPGEALTVLHVAQPTDGGVARAVTDLIRVQAAEGLRPVLLCPPDGPLSGWAEQAGAEVHPWPAGRTPGPGLFPETARVARAVRELRPDVVHLHSSKAGLAGRLAVRGRVPTVFQPHAWSFEAGRGRAAARALRWERRAAAHWTDRVLCVSEAERRRGEEAGIEADWAVVPNGVDLARHRSADAIERNRLRASLRTAHPFPEGRLSARSRLVVCVARLCRQKGQDVLLDAWPEVAARVPGACLALVGDGPDRERLQDRAPEEVVFAGEADDPWPWYAAADLVVLPSRWEGMALAPLEAMACGRAVVLSDVDGARESLPPGLAGPCLVAPEDPAALAGAITGLLGDSARRRAVGARARGHVREAHDVRRTAAEVTALYHRIAHPAAPARTG
ncbi:glycosyltransferase family 4 protein [Streptomyces aidingensis]|uniref:Glycosyltransferase involved in cell wall bisynthesis n=1 Tax=Streptomyces aidingensis TaxID=910347 RepID=A0A1I1QZB6_9ACTN|nr:glycosyltransferase family 4 protein [Streptomyces aidingensis]SFD23380.1 Glycosyltransferase involved in cell wall bisynthesis [Streptomyces aidingensis]